MTIQKPAKRRTVARKTARTKAVRKPKAEMTIWDEIVALGKKIPPEELANFPTDGARNLHHYLDGAPKAEPD